jgi:hypothetical protein
VEVARKPHGCERSGLLPLGFRAGERGALHLLELRGRERGFAQHLGDELERRHQVLAAHLEVRAFAAHLHGGVQSLERILELGAAALLRAAHEHRAGEVARGLAMHQAFLVAPVQRQRGDHAPAARLLGKERSANPVR